ncbi:hypothetical protein G7B40_032485 [Aetokthonos hydrillicola Thurmond2011]|uniref:Uncharacterized protein n=1 Tax=Aetokthonos hydrillicola Thurmond2011 TaxID=2712845 RepID=A0AAP5ICX9_9CYAN|nr:hypothetical protein [Aetokthonos hydrillicola]MBO3462733.1 hypothetical protein [Aetokthonos hydrillicola CCALA 1050]MBW4585739.1 hypothetical protein [Aetokthonos hydrillicola CCALA 1050]MDR9899243.1 hypothetical protein [Aetokthonos hydrillicola Thurmond2011]
MTIKKTVSLAKSIAAIVGLTALTVLKVSPPANAESFTCGPGHYWVETCPAGLNEFNDSVSINIRVSGGPYEGLSFVTQLSGQAQILRGWPVSKLVKNGNSWTWQNGEIKTEIVNLTATGASPLSPSITVVAGDGVPDLVASPSSRKSLYSSGSITQKTDNLSLADSVFNVFLEIQGTPEGTLHNNTPITLHTVTPLTQFPQNSIEYVSTDTITLYNADGLEIAKLVPDSAGRSVVLTLTKRLSSEHKEQERDISWNWGRGKSSLKTDD